MTYLVIESPTHDRAVVHEDALEQWLQRDFAVVGVTSNQHRLLTDVEQAELERVEDAESAARVLAAASARQAELAAGDDVMALADAVFAPEPDPAPDVEPDPEPE